MGPPGMTGPSGRGIPGPKVSPRRGDLLIDVTPLVHPSNLWLQGDAGPRGAAGATGEPGVGLPGPSCDESLNVSRLFPGRAGISGRLRPPGSSGTRSAGRQGSVRDGKRKRTWETKIESEVSII